MKKRSSDEQNEEGELERRREAETTQGNPFEHGQLKLEKENKKKREKGIHHVDCALISKIVTAKFG